MIDHTPITGWTVQQGLSVPEYQEAIEAACRELNIGYQTVSIYPFDKILPQMKLWRSNIFYGSVSYNNLLSTDIEMRKGIFFDSKSFSMKNYLQKWSVYMLNRKAELTSFAQLMAENYDSDKLLFIRPDDDTKSFAGTVKAFSELPAWYEELSMYNNTNLSLSSPIIAGPPCYIDVEWRLWIVKRKVVASSRYRRYFKSNWAAGCPNDVIQFAEKRCSEYVPHDVFVMDICYSGGSYHIIECGCMNAAGFYAADVKAIVESVTRYVSPGGEITFRSNI